MLGKFQFINTEKNRKKEYKMSALTVQRIVKKIDNILIIEKNIIIVITITGSKIRSVNIRINDT